MLNSCAPMVLYDSFDNNSFDGSSSEDEEDFITLLFILSIQQRPTIQWTPCTTSALIGHERMVVSEWLLRANAQ